MSRVVIEIDFLIVRQGPVLSSYPVMGQLFPFRLALTAVRDRLSTSEVACKQFMEGVGRFITLLN